jgi:predicted RNase H-like HicB family nuclease
MSATTRLPLDHYLSLAYPLSVTPDPDGGYVIEFPDLPGCMTQVESLAEIGTAADEIQSLWIETEYDLGRDIPAPSRPPEYSGKFNVRLPRSLHRSLVEAAEQEGVSLNQYVVALLARGNALRWAAESAGAANYVPLAQPSRSHGRGKPARAS